MPYNLLEVTADCGVHSKEEVHYLLEDRETGAPSTYGTSKACFTRPGGVTITIAAQKYILLTHYALKSAN